MSDFLCLGSLVLTGLSLNYWMKHIDGRPAFSELHGVFKALEQQFDTPAHQKQIKVLGRSVIIKDSIKRNNCSRIKALCILYHEFALFGEQFSSLKRKDAFKIQTLMKTMERYHWSRPTEEDVRQDDGFVWFVMFETICLNCNLKNESSHSEKTPETADGRRLSTTSTFFSTVSTPNSFPSQWSYFASVSVSISKTKSSFQLTP